MSPGIVIGIFFGSLLILLAAGLPIAFALGGMSVVFTILLWGPQHLGFVAQRVFELMFSLNLVAIPLFIFMALTLQFSGIGNDLYEVMYRWLGRLGGGLAMGTVLICTVIAAMSGISGAGIVMMGILALPEMLKRGYDKSIAIGCILAGGVLGNLIPPSCSFIVYGMLARESIGRLFAGGILPGLILSGLYIVYIGVRCRLQPSLGPPIPQEERFTWKEKIASLRGVILPVLLVSSVLGSIFTGLASPTEAAAIGALGAIICAVIHRKFNWEMLKSIHYETLLTTGMVIWIVIGAFCFSAIFTALGGQEVTRSLVLGLGLSPKMVILMMQGSYLLLGCFLDDISILAISLPAYLPIVKELGFNTLWFGILWQVNMQVAYLTPPFGYCLFFLKGVAPKDVTMSDIYHSVGPFVALQIIGLLLVWQFPQLALWIPSILLGAR